MFTLFQVIVGVHSDESYFKLKNKHAIDNTEKRMSNVKKYADQVRQMRDLCLEIQLKMII